MKQKEFYQGVVDTLPLMLGVFPFGLAYGIVSQSVGLTPAETLFMSLTVFAGAAQFVSLPMFAEGAGIVMLGFTAFLINLRHLLMGASLSPHLQDKSLLKKAILTFGMADETYAVTISRTQTVGYNAFYQLGSNTTGYVTWAVSTIAGIIVGSSISDPLSWGLDFAMPATFLALLIPRLCTATSRIVCAVAVVVSVAGAIYIPGKWYIILACLIATGIGGLLEGKEANEN